MKKFLIAFFLMASFTMYAQEAEHLTFKGEPIDGTLSEYVAKMKNAGFKYLGEQDGTAILQGDFAGFKSCTVGVSTLKAVNVVSTIGVIFPACEDWGSLERDYEHLKSMLTQKYGEPSMVVEKFTGSYQPEDNIEKLNELNMDRCVWFTEFTMKNGVINLSMKKDKMVFFGGYHVVLYYYDKINTDKVRSAAIDDL